MLIAMAMLDIGIAIVITAAAAAAATWRLQQIEVELFGANDCELHKRIVILAQTVPIEA